MAPAEVSVLINNIEDVCFSSFGASLCGASAGQRDRIQELHQPGVKLTETK